MMTDEQVADEIRVFYRNKYGRRLVRHAERILQKHATARNNKTGLDVVEKLHEIRDSSRSARIAFEMFLSFVFRKRELAKNGDRP